MGYFFLRMEIYRIKKKDMIIRNAKRGMMFIDSRHYHEQTHGTVNEMIAHECFHWYRHQPYHLLMKMLGVRDDLGRVIRCTVDSVRNDTEKRNSFDWIEWQANRMVPYILMPAKMATQKIEEMLREYHTCFDNPENGSQMEELISRLAKFYGLSKQATKTRISELGFHCVNNVLVYASGWRKNHL